MRLFFSMKKARFLVIGIFLGLLIEPIYSQEDSLYVGCMIEVSYYPYLKSRLEVSDNPRDQADRHALLDYRIWKEEVGDSIITRWRNGEEISAHDSSYLPVMKATYMWPSYLNGSYRNGTRPSNDQDAYTWDVVKNAGLALKKLYRHDALSATDSSALIDYRIFIEMKSTGAVRLPYQLGISRTSDFTPGETAPDFRGFKLDTLLNSPKYHDGEEGIRDRLTFFKPEGVEEFYTLSEGYVADGTTRVKELINSAGSDSNFVHLSNYINQKPLVMIVASSRDVFFPRCYGMMEALKQAYGDKLDFLIVDIEIHDAHMDPPEYFGEYAGANRRTYWAINAEQRARVSKIMSITYPYVTVPFVVDDKSETIRNKYNSEGGDGQFFILDRNGKVAYQMKDGWGQYSFTISDYSDDILWTNHLEKYILKLINNNGVYDPKATFPWPGAVYKSAIPSRLVERDNRWGAFPWPYQAKEKLWKMANIVAIDTINHELIFQQYDYSSFENEMTGYNFIKSEGNAISLYKRALINSNELEKWLSNTDSVSRIFTYKIDNGVELFLNGEEIIDERSLKVGDFVNVKYDISTFNDYPVQVRASRRNFTPEIDSVETVIVLKNSEEQTITLKGISDGNSSSDQKLTITASSTDESIIADPSIEYSGGDSAIISFTPLPDVTGTLSFIVKLKDTGGIDFNGSDTTIVHIEVLVLPNVDSKIPTLTEIPSLDLLEDSGEQQIALTGISDGEGGADIYSISALSMNHELIPDPIIEYTVGESTATLKFESEANTSGETTIEVTVTDNDQLKITRSFIVKITAVNDPPGMDPIGDVTIDQDEGLQSIDLTGIHNGGDEYQIISILASSDNLSLIKDFSLKFSYWNDYGSFWFEPEEGEYGTAEITLALSDNGGTANGGEDEAEFSFLITVNQITSDSPLRETNCDFSIMPNPASGNVTITSSSLFQKITITDILGRILLVKLFDSERDEERINIQDLPKGQYIITLSSEGKKYSKSFLKN